jgi:NAD(P)-dependent dehydrogenase (short-subunit alcohol dehydrogenase family)
VRRASIEETTLELWNEVMAVNATGVFLGTKHALPIMRRGGGGSIVNISSISGMIAVGAPAYNASKGAVRVFTKITAVEHAKDHIRCNSIHPGPIDTQMIREGHVDPDAMAQQRLSLVPLGRLGTVDDIAYGVLYLASDEAAFVTGSELVIDGGFIAQ